MASRLGPFLVVGRPYDFSAAPFDGFATRRAQLLRTLGDVADFAVLLLRPPHDAAVVRPELAPRVLDEIPIEIPDTSRKARLIRVADARRYGSHRGLPADDIRAATLRSSARAALTFGPWLQSEFEPVFAALPTLHFFEEDLQQMPGMAPNSWRAKLYRRLLAGLERLVPHQPMVVAAISPRELSRARRRYPRSRVAWVPFGLDPAEYPLASGPSSGTSVLLVGNYAEARNAEALAGVLAAMPVGETSGHADIISGAGLHADLRRYAQEGRIRVLDDVSAPYHHYRSAALTLIPARHVSGVKTTLLQAWAAGTPVVCHMNAAASVGPFARQATVSMRTPEQLALATRLVLSDRDRQLELSAAGRALYRRYFAPDVVRRALIAHLRDLQHASPALRASGPMPRVRSSSRGGGS